MKIGLDIDGVLTDFDGGWVDQYERWFGVTVDREKLGSWSAWKNFTHFADESEFWAWIDVVPNFWRDLAPVPGALGGVYKLSRLFGHEICFISNRKPHNREQTLEWFRRNLPIANVLPDLHLVPARSKGNVDVQVYVEDSPRELEALAAIKPCVIVFDQPWNRDVKSGHNVHRVRGWDELCQFVWYLEHPEDSLENADTLPFEPVQ